MPKKVPTVPPTTPDDAPPLLFWFPRHFQDCIGHCGHACATMMLDWLKKGKKYQPAGGNSLSGLSQVMMHRYEKKVPNWSCTPAQLRNLINERISLSNRPNIAQACDYARDDELSIRRMIEHSAKSNRPAVALVDFADYWNESKTGPQRAPKPLSPGETHWVIVRGVAMNGLTVSGYFLLDPWVAGKQPAYDYTECHKECQEPPTEFFIHKRGDGCQCPDWNSSGKNAGSYVAGIYVQHSLWLAKNTKEAPFQYHAVLYGTKAQRDADENSAGLPAPAAPIVRKQKVIDAADTRNLSEVHMRLTAAGVTGDGAPHLWQDAFVRADPAVVRFNKPSGGGVLMLWPASTSNKIVAGRKTPAGTRLAAIFDSRGVLKWAAVLVRWPELEKPATVLGWFRVNGPRLCREAGLTIDLTDADTHISVEEELHWESCEQSALPCWPFYVFKVGPKKKTVTVFLDLARRVHLSLTKSTKIG